MTGTTHPRFRRFAAAGLAAAAGLTIAACGGSGGKGGNPLSQSASKGTVVIGSANFPEDELLATIYAQALQAKGVKVTTKLNIGSREVYYPEIKKGALSIIPEYNGALLTGPVDPTSTAASTAQVDAELKAKLPSTLEILNPSSAVDSDSVTVTQATAKRYHLTSISDITPSEAKHWVFGGPPEFNTRSDGIPGLKKRYGLDFKFKQTDESSTVTFTDLKNGTVQAADVFTTAPQIITDHFVTLADPKHNFAAQNVLPLVYKPAMTPKITSTLNAVSAALSTNALLQMDKALDINHASYSQVAAGFLKAVHLG